MSLGHPSYSDNHQTFGELENYLWQVDEYNRLISLGLKAPHLLKFEEQQIWDLICRTGWFWKGKYEDDDSTEWLYDVSERGIVRERVEEKWDLLKQVAEGNKDKSELPKVSRAENYTSFKPTDDYGQSSTPSFGGPDLDDDIPF